MHPLPKISIITPSFNQGIFLEATILSVLGQQYPNLEYIIIDGGSNDNSVDIIKKYDDKIHYWISEKDNGQSNAINKGFNMASGEILMWLNSDDLLMPGSLFCIAKTINLDKPSIYFGNCIHFKNENGLVCYGSNVCNWYNSTLLENADFIIQPSSFWTKKTWNIVGKLNEELNYVFDWEWFLRAKANKIYFQPIEDCISMYRIHPTHKSSTGGTKRDDEIAHIYKIFSPFNEKLFRYLVEDKFLLNKISSKLIKKGAFLFSYPVTQTQILKLLKPKKYKKFTTATMDQVKQMVAYY